MVEPIALLETMDRAAFDILSQNQPKLVEELRATLATGGTAKQVEARMMARYGQNNLTAALVVCAAYYIERNGKQEV